MTDKQLNDLKKAHARLLGKLIHRKVKENIPSNIEPEEYTLKFGMHRGTPLKDVPKDYLRWMLLNVKNRPDAVAMVQKFMGIIPPAPVRPKVDGGKGPSFSQYRELIARHYNTSKGYDISTFNERGLFLYQRCMDSCRKMRAIIESMEESPAALGMLHTIHRDMCGLRIKAPVGACREHAGSALDLVAERNY